MVMDEPFSGAARVFGAFQLHDARGEPVRLPARSAAALVALLALRWRGVARAEIADTLWPDGEHEQARAALRTAVRRVRQALGEGAIVDEEGRLRLALESDAVRAARHRRARRRAAAADEALTAARAEWEIVRHDVLEGWEDDWVEPLRDDARLLANECGGALARLLEERGEPQAALDALDGVLRAVPHHAEALEQAMRLENALHGRERALARASEARASLGSGEGLVLPDSVRRLERAIRDEAAGYLPPPPTFSDGGDLTLIGHMFESSLRHGGLSALATLAEQAFSPVCLRHPHRTLDLLTKAIALTEGAAPERTAVMTAAIQHALYVGDTETTHALCDELIRNFPADHRLHNGSLMVKGGAYLTARDFERARRYMVQAVEGCTTEDRRHVALAQLGVLEAQELHFDRGIERVETACRTLCESSREDRERNLSSLLAGLCDIHTAQGDWKRAVERGFEALAFMGATSPMIALVNAPLGLALVHEGRVEEGVARLRMAVVESYRERMVHAHVSSLDATAVALVRIGDEAVAESVLDAANAARRRLRFPRSPAGRLLVERSGLDVRAPRPGPLRLQSPGALAEWLGEALDRALASRGSLM